jgi:prepilin-type processing-associated H-X9-DG protein
MKIDLACRKTNGLTLLELIAIITILVVLIGLLLPALSTGKGSKRSPCVNHLKCLGLAARIFATDNEERFPWQVSRNKGGSQEYRDTPNSAFRHFLAMSNELSTPKLLLCPEDKKRIEAIHWSISNQNISYFLGLDAKKSAPQVLLSGDRNLMTNGVPVGSGLHVLTTNLKVGWTAQTHNNSGTVLFGDGHVDVLSNNRLQEKLINSSIATNRLLIP